MNRIRHNSPSLIQCLRAFHILFSAYLLFRCYCYNHYKIPKILLLLPLPLLSYYFATKNFAADIKLSRCGWIDNLAANTWEYWLPLCRINKFGLNTLPSKIVAIPYTCGLSILPIGFLMVESAICNFNEQSSNSRKPSTSHKVFGIVETLAPKSHKA